MKSQLPLFFFGILLGLTSCKKEVPPIINNTTPPEDTLKYAGIYDGWVEKHSAGVDADGVYKIDTAYVYTVTISDVGIGYISIHGSEIPSIAIDPLGNFSLNEYNHNIEGHFNGDSLYLYTEAISGSYDPPQFYDNTQINFSGKKVP